MLRESLQHTWSLSYNHFRITASPWIFKCCTFKRRCWPKYLKVSEFSRPRVKPKASSFEKSRKSWRSRRRKKFPELKTKKKPLLFFFSTPNSFSLRQRSQKINASVFIKWSRPKFRKMKISKLWEPRYLPCLFPVFHEGLVYSRCMLTTTQNTQPNGFRGALTDSILHKSGSWRQHFWNLGSNPWVQSLWEGALLSSSNI